jgi:hypothetical protein
MDPDEERILGYYNKPNYKVVKTFHGETAWKYILQIRYGAYSRPRVKKAFEEYTKVDAFLVVYLIMNNNLPEIIGADYYLNKRDITLTPESEQGEGNYNMYERAPYSLLEADDAPRILKKIFAV